MNIFDKVAERVSAFIAQAPYFMFCVVLIVAWTIGLPFAGVSNDTYHLFLNSPTTAITFLMVALLENSNRRGAKATHIKLDAILEALAELPDTDSKKAEIAKGIEEDIGA